MKKIEVDMSPLDNAIADVEETLQSVALYDVYEHEDDLLRNLDFSILDSNDEIKEELSGLSRLMGDLEHLLQKELSKVEEVQIKKAMEAALSKKQESDAPIEQQSAHAHVLTRSDKSAPSVPLSRKAYRKQYKKEDKKNQHRRGRRR